MSPHKYLLNTCDVPLTIRSAGDTVLNGHHPQFQNVALFQMKWHFQYDMSWYHVFLWHLLSALLGVD